MKMLYTRDEAKGFDMKEGSEKMLSIGGWGAAGVMHYFCCCGEVQYRCAQKRAKYDVKPNAKPPLKPNLLDTSVQM